MYEAAADTRLAENDPEGIAFEYEVLDESLRSHRIAQGASIALKRWITGVGTGAGANGWPFPHFASPIRRIRFGVGTRSECMCS